MPPMRAGRGAVACLTAVAICDENDLVVRLARDEDLPGLVSLLGLLFEQEDEFEVQPDAQRAGLEALLAASGRAEVLLAERAGRLLAMVTLPLVVGTAGGPVALPEDMVVDPSARGEGVGSMLLSRRARDGSNGIDRRLARTPPAGHRQ